jgi:hypothetical protein
VCELIVQRLHDQCVVMLNQDSFYRSLSEVHAFASHAHWREVYTLPATMPCRHTLWCCLSTRLLATQAELADVKNFNFDHPDAFDTPALLECLSRLKAGQAAEVPTYDFSLHARSTETKRVSGKGGRGGGGGAGCSSSVWKAGPLHLGWLLLPRAWCHAAWLHPTTPPRSLVTCHRWSLLTSS